MTFIIPQRSIWLCDFDMEGRKNSCKFRCHQSQLSNSFIENCPEHFFVVISKNNEQDFVTVLPITSKKYQIEKNAGVEISSDDIESLSTTKKEFVPTKLTLVLANKPCRIPKELLRENEDRGILKKEKYEDIFWEIRGCLMSN